MGVVDFEAMAGPSGDADGLRVGGGERHVLPFEREDVAPILLSELKRISRHNG
jgi:hypothetical protein